MFLYFCHVFIFLTFFKFLFERFFISGVISGNKSAPHERRFITAHYYYYWGHLHSDS